jgi:hypothetical protein
MKEIYGWNAVSIWKNEFGKTFCMAKVCSGIPQSKHICLCPVNSSSVIS